MSMIDYKREGKNLCLVHNILKRVGCANASPFIDRRRTLKELDHEPKRLMSMPSKVLQKIVGPG